MKVYRDVEYTSSAVPHPFVPSKIYNCTNGWVELENGVKVGYSPEAWKEYSGPVPAGYILWSPGDGCPVKDILEVEVILANTERDGGQACLLNWEGDSQIIAYRIVEEDKEVEEKGQRYTFLKRSTDQFNCREMYLCIDGKVTDKTGNEVSIDVNDAYTWGLMVPTEEEKIEFNMDKRAEDPVEDTMLQVENAMRRKEMAEASGADPKLPQSLIDLAINELIADIKKHHKESQYGDAIEIANILRKDRWAIDDTQFKDLSEYLQSIAK